jgi:hypothetical protein
MLEIFNKYPFVFTVLAIIIVIAIIVNPLDGEYSYNINQKWLVIQYDDRDLTNHPYNKLVNINKEYCKLYNLDYTFINKGYDNYSPYWVKVKILHDYINDDKYKHYDGFIWIDTDAVFSNKDKNILSLTNDTHSLYISPDTITYNLSTQLETDIYDNNLKLHHALLFTILNNFNNIIPIYNPLCVGVFLIKNNEIGKNIINEWWDTYNPDMWNKINGKWQTDGEWAGLDYEQGSFTTFIYPEFKKSIKVLHSSALADINYKHANSYVSHYMGSRKKFIDQHY